MPEVSITILEERKDGKIMKSETYVIIPIAVIIGIVCFIFGCYFGYGIGYDVKDKEYQDVIGFKMGPLSLPKDIIEECPSCATCAEWRYNTPTGFSGYQYIMDHGFPGLTQEEWEHMYLKSPSDIANETLAWNALTPECRAALEESLRKNLSYTPKGAC